MDAASAQRVPQHRGVDDEYRFAEPVLGFIGQFHHDQVGPKLHDGIGIGITKITQGGSCRRLVYYGNRERCWAIDAMQPGDLVSCFREEAHVVLVHHRRVRRQQPELLDVVKLQRRGCCGGRGSNRDRGNPRKELFKTLAAGKTVQEGERGDTDQQWSGPAVATSRMAVSRPDCIAPTAAWASVSPLTQDGGAPCG